LAKIELYEIGPSRSLKVRWALQETGLPFEIAGDTIDILGSDDLKRAHPLGKVPAVLIDGKPLFESAAIVTAIADLAPAAGLIAAPGTWERHLHDQWSFYAVSELESCAWTAYLNTREVLFPADRFLPAAVDQAREIFDRNAPALVNHLANNDYVMGNAFSITDINVVYPLHLANLVGWLDSHSVLTDYFERLKARPNSTL
jgi:glutathione S-transferase